MITITVSNDSTEVKAERANDSHLWQVTVSVDGEVRKVMNQPGQAGHMWKEEADMYRRLTIAAFTINEASDVAKTLTRIAAGNGSR